MQFSKAPLIRPNQIFVERRVGRQAGNRRMMALVKRKEIAPVVTPTGITLLTPVDAEKLFNAFDE